MVDTSISLISIDEIVKTLREQISKGEMPWAEQTERALYEFVSELTGLSEDRISELMLEQCGKEMLERIQNVTDLYNPEDGLYVFCYNDDGAICVYDKIDVKRAEEIARNAKEAGEHWSQFLGFGGDVYEEDGENGKYQTNLEWCIEHCTSKWIDTDKYLDTLPEKNDAETSDEGQYKVYCKVDDYEYTVELVLETDDLGEAVSEALCYIVPGKYAEEFREMLIDDAKFHVEVRAEGKLLFYVDQNGGKHIEAEDEKIREAIKKVMTEVER